MSSAPCRGRTAFAVPLAAVLVVLSLVSGCGGSSTSADSELCDSVARLQDAASALGGLGLSSTRDEVRQVVDEVLVAVGDVADDLGAVAQSDAAAVRASFAGLSAQLRSLPDDATLAEAVAAVQQAAPALQAALTQVLDGVDCGGSALAPIR
jgi:hypothetical protein